MSTFTQRKAIQRYCEIQRTARSEFRSQAREPVVKFPTPPGAPGSDPQPGAWIGSFPFLIGLAVVVGSLVALASQGWLP